jgi:membrane-associated protein
MTLPSIFADAADMNIFQLGWDIVTNLQQYVQWWVEDIGSVKLTAILFLIIFCETGLVVMPWLPGDSLLFVAGALCAPKEGLKFTEGTPWYESIAHAAQNGQLNLALLCVLLPLAAILGDNLNYWVGRYIGPRVFKKQKSFFFNADILHRTQKFYDKHGGKMVMLARFVPLVRTFAPFVAGVGKMDYRRFFGYGVLGAFIWVVACCGAGFFFGNIPWVKERFELIVLAVIGISVAPAIFAWMQARAEMKREKAAGGGSNS